MKTVKQRSQKQEKSVAKDLEAKLVVASGALWGAKGDVRSDKCLIECKTTEKSYYSITSKVWEKIDREALKDGMRTPLLIIDLEDNHRFVVFNPEYFSNSLPIACYGKSNRGDKKSFRITLDSFDTLNKKHDCYFYGILFVICGKKENLLCCMRFKDFIETYKEEL